jgi:hypothetical protein
MTAGVAAMLPLASGFDTTVFVIVVVATLVSQILKAARRAPQPGDPAAAEPTRPPPPATAPEDELRKFLSSLTGMADEAPSAPPRPPPPAPVAVPAIASRRSQMPVRKRPAPRVPRVRPARVTAKPVHRRAPQPPRRAGKPALLRPARTTAAWNSSRRSPTPAPPLPVGPAPVTALSRSAATAPKTQTRRDDKVAVVTPATHSRRHRLLASGPNAVRARDGKMERTQSGIDALRAAIVWREVLSQPVALRRPSDPRDVTPA